MATAHPGLDDIGDAAMMSFDLSLMLDKRSSERKLFHVDLSLDLPRDALITQILDVLVDDVEVDPEAEYTPLDVAPAHEWAINYEPVRYPDGRLVQPGKATRGAIGGGTDGYVYTIRILYERSDDRGPHEATVLMRVRDHIRPLPSTTTTA